MAVGRRCLALLLMVAACGGDAPPAVAPAACDPDNAGLTLPDGFCATVFADLDGAPRHIVVAPSGIVYVTLLNGPVVALQDTNADGHADLLASAGSGHHTGIALVDAQLFVDAAPFIVRYTVPPDRPEFGGPPDTIVRGLPAGGHGSRSIAIDPAGNLYVGIGSAGNLCGGNADPCPELASRAGIWRFTINQADQPYTAAARFASGIRNAVGLAVNPGDGRLYATQHGRDNLQNFPALFDLDAAAENPAEELLRVDEGADYGWPYCYFDDRAAARVLAPEYGGDRRQAGRCDATTPPVTVLPGHWAPNALAFHPAAAWPARYRNGAFIAFHGSWNRAPRPQGGFNVVFVPAVGGVPGESWEVFATGFAGIDPIQQPGQAQHRPSGLAVAPDGALFVTDDAGGRIYRIVYRGTD
jgi:glucose/arabinose dehydrogenase